MAGLSTYMGMLLVGLGAMPPPVHYDIGLDVRQGEVEAITARVTVGVGDDGVVDFDAPTQRPVEVHAESGTLDTTTAGRWRVTAAPHGEVVLSWKTPRPETVGDNFYPVWQVVVSRPGTVLAYNTTFLPIPRGAGTRQVTATTTAPPGWQVSSPLGARTRAVKDLAYTFFLASRDMQTVTRQIWPGTTLRIDAVGPDPAYLAMTATAIADTLGRLKKPAGAPANFSLNIVTLGEGTGWGSSASGAVVSVVLPRQRGSNGWLLDAISSFITASDKTEAETSRDAANAWFTRGVVSYRVAHALHDQGFVDNAALAWRLDWITTAYGNSSLRRAPNARVVEDYDRIREIRDVAMARGELFAWPERRIHAWKTLLQARAIENQCYVIGVNRVGNDGNNIYHNGNSMLAGPLGEVLYEKQHEEDIFTITLQKDTLDETRTKLPFLKDADKFTISNE